ncbi:MAG TPA: AEC family transporter [Gammaproteobacteria bacterium]|nr:AEC family transporter [Gammaproteobacteria bacterium]
MINQVAAVLLPVFAIAGIGYLWRQLGAPFDLAFVTRLIMNLAGPCLVFDSLANLTLPPQQFVAMVGASIALLAVTAVLAFAVLKVLKLPLPSYLPALTIGNTGNLGLPLCLFAFGEAGLGLAVAVYVTNSVAQFTLVPLLQTRQPLVKTLLTTPVIYGAVAGALALAYGAGLPKWLDNTAQLLGGLMIPLMLLALGYTIGGLRTHNLPRALGLGATRLAIAFAAAFGVARLLHLSGVAQGVLLLQGTMPAAVFTYLFAARYERDADDVAGIVLISTLLAALLLPLLVSYALVLSGK